MPTVSSSFIYYPRPAKMRCAAEIEPMRDALSEVMGVEKEHLFAPTRLSPRIAFARQVAIYIMHTTFGFSHMSVARCFKRDRTTIRHSVTLIEEKRGDPAFDQKFVLLEAAMKVRLGATKVEQ